MSIRTCMYCGRELASGEHCTCPHSMYARQATQKSHKTTTSKPKSEWYKHVKDKARTVFHKRPHFKQSGNSNFLKQFISLVGGFFVAPVQTVLNPGILPKAMIVVLVALEGFLLSIVSFLATGIVGRGLLQILSNMIGFKGVSGWKNVIDMLSISVGGMIFFVAMFFLLAGLFFFISKWILRLSISFWDLASRIAVCGIPMLAIGLFGIIFTLFSVPTLLILILCGFILQLILLYESLKSLWQTSQTKALYLTGGGMFLYLCICFNILRLFIR